MKFNLKMLFGIVIGTVLVFGLTGCFDKDTNHKYQVSQFKTCKSDGTPNFLLLPDGQKAPNPPCNSIDASGKCICEHPVSDWPINTGVYLCYNKNKPVKYGCSKDNA